MRGGTSHRRANTTFIKDKNQMKAFCDGMKNSSKKIELGTDRYSVNGNAFIIMLSDKVPEDVKREFEKLNVEQLNWMLVNSDGLKSKYGEVLVGTVIDGYCASYVEKREISSVLTGHTSLQPKR